MFCGRPRLTLPCRSSRRRPRWSAGALQFLDVRADICQDDSSASLTAAHARQVDAEIGSHFANGRRRCDTGGGNVGGLLILVGCLSGMGWVATAIAFTVFL